MPLEIVGNMCIAIVTFQAHDVINFEMNLAFLSNRFSRLLKTSGEKFKNYSEQKELLRRNKRQFSSILKKFQLFGPSSLVLLVQIQS